MSIARTMMETAGKEYNGETIEGAIKATGGSSGIYDIVIWQDTTTSVPAYEVISGDWKTVKEKIMDGEIINGILKSHEKNSTAIRFTSLVAANYNESPESITLTFIPPSWNGNNVTWFPVLLIWTSDGQITN